MLIAFVQLCGERLFSQVFSWYLFSNSNDFWYFSSV